MIEENHQAREIIAIATRLSVYKQQPQASSRYSRIAELQKCFSSHFCVDEMMNQQMMYIANIHHIPRRRYACGISFIQKRVISVVICEASYVQRRLALNFHFPRALHEQQCKEEGSL